jgi:hypothetical protein
MPDGLVVRGIDVACRHRHLGIWASSDWASFHLITISKQFALDSCHGHEWPRGHPSGEAHDADVEGMDGRNRSAQHGAVYLG